jgi:hypothetical protein
MVKFGVALLISFIYFTATADEVAVNTIAKNKTKIAVPGAQQFVDMQPYRAEYNARSSKMPLSINAVHTFEKLPNGQAQLTTEAHALLSTLKETALLDWQNCNSQSLRYDYDRQVFGKSVHYQQFFDAAQIRYVRDNTTTNIALTSTQQVDDRLLSQFKLRCHVKAGKTNFSLQMIDKDQIKTQSYKVVGTQKLRLPIGEVNSLEVERLREPSSKRTTSIWVAPQWDYLVVKAIQEDDDGVVTLELVSLEFLK